MSEFKFACPVCGQHITSGAEASGREMQCPTCFQKIIAPQVTASGGTKFILSGTKAQEPRPIGLIGNPGETSGTTRLGTRTAVVFVLAGLLVAAAGAWVLRDWFFQEDPPSAAHASAPAPFVPVPKDFGWKSELKNVAFPEQPVAGRIHGTGFIAHRVTLEGGTLSFRHTKQSGLGMTVGLFAKSAADLSGKVIVVTADRQPPLPKVVLRWKNEQRHPQTETIPSGYAMKLSFGQAEGTNLTGRIYICLPDEAKSFAAGTFRAEIREPEGRPRMHEGKSGSTNIPKTNPR
jgi:hypothetical protein